MTTMERRSGRRWSAEKPGSRMTALAEAFRSFTASIPDLRVEVVGNPAADRQLVHPVAGFHVFLEGDDGVGISLYVSSSYGELVRWRAAAGALREKFDVQIDEAGYAWGDSTYPTAAELAHDLLAYMQFSLDALPRS